MTFKEFVISGAYTNTGWEGYDLSYWGAGRTPTLPVPTLTPPVKVVEGVITHIMYTNNPITICVGNTTWNLTKDQWDTIVRHKKKPCVNDRVRLEMYLDGTIRSVNFY